MKKVLVSIFLICLFTNLYSQELSGVWVSNDNLIHKTSTPSISEKGVSIINFDKGVMTSINSLENNTVQLNKKETKIKIKGLKGKLNVNKSSEDAIVLKDKNNISYIFKKLVSSNELDLNTKDISNFLLNQHCGLIQDIQAEFKNEQFFIDKRYKRPRSRFQVINYSTRDNGYWYIKNTNGHVLLVFTTEQNSAENVFQIISLDLKGFKLNQLYSDNHIKNLSLMKTCL